MVVKLVLMGVAYIIVNFKTLNSFRHDCTIINILRYFPYC